jgi:transcriptional regulator with XRE-family HTH domain
MVGTRVGHLQGAAQISGEILKMASDRSYKLRPSAITRLLVERGISLDGLARRSGVHIKTLRRWLKGTPGFIDKIKKVAQVLDVSHMDIIQAVEGDMLLEGGQLPRTTEFTANISLSGTLESPEHMARVLTLTPWVISALAAEGIKISGYDQRLTIAERAGLELKRIIVLLYGLLANGNSFWLFAAIRPSKYQMFMAAQKANVLDLQTFDPFGEIVVSGEGRMPPDDVILKVAEMYQTTPEILMEGVKGPE